MWFYNLQENIPKYSHLIHQYIPEVQPYSYQKLLFLLTIVILFCPVQKPMHYDNTYHLEAILKKEETHKMAEANKAFAHYKW